MSGGYLHIKINNSIEIYGGSSGNNNSTINPVSKNDVITLNASGGGGAIYFIPCIGG